MPEIPARQETAFLPVPEIPARQETAFPGFPEISEDSPTAFLAIPDAVAAVTDGTFPRIESAQIISILSTFPNCGVFTLTVKVCHQVDDAA